MSTLGRLPRRLPARNESTIAFFTVSDEKWEWVSAADGSRPSVVSTRSVPSTRMSASQGTLRATSYKSCAVSTPASQARSSMTLVAVRASRPARRSTPMSPSNSQPDLPTRTSGDRMRGPDSSLARTSSRPRQQDAK